MNRIERSTLSLVFSAGAAVASVTGWNSAESNHRVLEGVAQRTAIVSQAHHGVEGTAIILNKILHPHLVFGGEPKDQPSLGRVDLVAQLQDIELGLPDSFEEIRAQIRAATDNLAYKTDLNASSVILNSVSQSIGDKELLLEQQSSSLRHKIKEGVALFYGGVAGGLVGLSSLILGLRRPRKSPEAPIRKVEKRELVKAS